MESFFATLSKKPDCSNFSKKVSEFFELMSCKSINNISGAAFGLCAEIKTLQKVWELQASFSCFSRIEIPLDSDSKNGKKIGDVRAVCPSTNSYQCFESKCKKPGFGFHGNESKLNDYLMSIVPLISDYINICIPTINMFQLFPRLWRRHKHVFGCLSDLIKDMSKRGFRVNYSENELSKIGFEEEVLKNIFNCFYDDAFIDPEADLIPSCEENLSEMKQQAEMLFTKDFLPNTIKSFS